jgi:hypothetical protein
VRRFLAIAVLLFIGLPMISPLLALSSATDANVPACCRRDGKHHCMLKSMGQMDGSDSPGINFGMLSERCPVCPKALPVATQHPFALEPASAVLAELFAHPASLPQTQAKFRVSFSRSRQKRGPPVVVA